MTFVGHSFIILNGRHFVLVHHLGLARSANYPEVPNIASCLVINFCQAQPQLQVKLSLKAELALFSFNPATHPARESLFPSISQ